MKIDISKSAKRIFIGRCVDCSNVDNRNTRITSIVQEENHFVIARWKNRNQRNGFDAAV